MKDFFISYNKADCAWAEWIAWQLEEEGYTTILQVWDFRPGSNFARKMQQATSEAKQTIAVLSPDYLTSEFTQPEWLAAFAQDPSGDRKTLIPIRVRKCELKGLLRQIIYLDIVGLDETAARQILIKGIFAARAKPERPPQFPASIHSVVKPKQFPGNPDNSPPGPSDSHQTNIEPELPLVTSPDSQKAIKPDLVRRKRRDSSRLIRRTTGRINVVGLRPQYITTQFKNRSTEIVALRESLAKSKLVSVVGHGGTGKTALACKVLIDLENTEDIAGLIYFTAANIQTTNLESIFSAMGRILACEREIVGLYNDLNKPLRQRIELLFDRVERDGGKYVLLLDNFEKYQDENGGLTDDELRLFLEMSLLHSGALRIVLTTRIALRLPTTISGFYSPISLEQGLPFEDAADFLVELDPENLGGLQTAGRKTLIQLAQRTGGYPRALQAVASLLREDPILTPGDLLARADLFTGNVIDGLVHESLRRLDERSLQVLQGLAVYGQPVPEVAIKYLLEPHINSADTHAILRRLTKSHFVIFDKSTKTFSLHPIDRAFAYQQLPLSTTADGGFSRRGLAFRAANYFATTRLPEKEWNNIADLQTQLSEFEQRVITNDFDGAARLLDMIDVKYLLLWGHAQKVFTMRAALEHKLSDKQLQINQASSLGLSCKGLGLLQHAIEYFQRMLALARDDSNTKSEVRALNELSNIYRRLADYDEALGHSKQALTVAREINDQSGEGQALMDISNIYWCLGRYKESIDYCQQALNIARLTNDKNAEAYALGSLGSNNLSLLRVEQGLNNFASALKIFRDIGNRQGEGYALANLGLAHKQLGKLTQAIQLCRQAVAIYKAIENRRGVGHSYFILATIHRAEGNLAEAKKCAEMSIMSLAEANVPEAQTAKALEKVIHAAISNDKLAEAEALLECACSPPNTGDLRESLDFAQEACIISRAEQCVDVLARAQSFIDEVHAKIAT